MKKTLDKSQYTWNLSPLFQGDDDPQMAKERNIVERENYQFINKWSKRNDYLTDAKVLKEALDEYEVLQGSYGDGGKEGYYFWLRTSQDQNDPKLKAKFNQIQDFFLKIYNDLQFFTLRLSRIPVDDQRKFLENAQLKPYKHFLEKLFKKSKYLLSEDEEKILNLKSVPAHSNWVKMTSGFLYKEERLVLLENGKKEVKNLEEIINLLISKKKKVRDNAAKAFNNILAQYTDVAEAEINSILSNKKIDDDLRRMPRPDFERLLGDDLDPDIVDSLIEVVSKRFEIAQKYYQLKTRLMGLNKLEYHERNVEINEVNKKYSWDDAKELIKEVFEDLDEKFAEIFQKLVKNGQIDVFPRKGKRGGAFCADQIISLPTYVLHNYTESMRDVLTLAHESGHAINSELMREKQNALNFGTPLSTAEVASTFMEDFILQKLLQGASDETRLTIMMMKLNEDISTIFRQIAFYKFEQELHQNFRTKGYLSKEDIGKLFQKHTAAYMGPAVIQSPGSENWWIYVSHFRSFFYVYSYASGLLISKSLQASVKKDPLFIEQVKNFLSAGFSDSPKNIFKNLGIDITDKGFWNKGLDEIEALLNDTEGLAKKLGKIS